MPEREPTGIRTRTPRLVASGTLGVVESFPRAPGASRMHSELARLFYIAFIPELELSRVTGVGNQYRFTRGR